MNDATKKAADGADLAAPEAESTDEQLWNEIEAEDKANEPEPDDLDDAKGAEKDEGKADDGFGDGGDADPSPSEDARKGDKDGDAPVVTDPDALQAQLERLHHALNSEKGRTAASRREIERLRSEIGSAREAQKSKKDDDPSRKERQEKLQAAREEYGDVIGPLADTISELESRIESLSAREAAELKQRQDRYGELIEAETKVFETEHPDGFDVIIKNRKAFDDWIEDQPKAIRDIYAANRQEIVDGTGSALLVGMFKEALFDASSGSDPDHNETQRLQSRRQRQLAGARTLKTNSRQAASSRPSKDSDDANAHWDYFERMDRGR